MAFEGETGIFQLALGEVAIRLGAGQGAGSLGNEPISFATGFAGCAVCLCEAGKICSKGVVSLRRADGLGVCLFKIAFQFDETVQLLEPQGGGGGGVLCGGAETIPTPEIAFETDEALTGLEGLLKPGTVGGIDKADLTHATDQNLWHGDKIRQRLNAFGQRGRGFVASEGGPTGFDALATKNGCAEIIGKRRAERLFVAAFDLQEIKHLPAFGGIALDEPRQCVDFCAECVRLALGIRAGRAGVDFAVLCGGPGLIGGGECGIGLFGTAGGFGIGLLRCGEVLLGFGDGSFRLRHCGFGLLGGGFGFVQGGAAVVKEALGRLVPRGKAGDVFG